MFFVLFLQYAALVRNGFMKIECHYLLVVSLIHDELWCWQSYLSICMAIIILLLGNLVQGNCKHTIVIRDMRFIHPEDVQNRAGYPIVLFQLKFRVQKCNICKIYRATKVTVNDKWALKNPCYFCKDCYFLLHYGKDESLLYSDFSVYDYLHD